MQKFSVNQHLISTILGWVESDSIAIPEIQRPFVWESTKVRDLMDSLYKGFPIGYLITWRNPNTKLKDGTTATGKTVIIDGQQRIIAMRAAILGLKVINKSYREVEIKISFNPITEKFETKTPAYEKNPQWIADISQVLTKNGELIKIYQNYVKKNPDVDKDIVEQNLSKLFEMKTRQIGVIDLEQELDIETVTDIFLRINSKGVKLSQADFVMSKIASNEKYQGGTLRKSIDYFGHLCEAPEFYKELSEVDKEFVKTDYYKKLSWLKNEKIDLYVPDYNDILRVSFASNFKRGKLKELVSLLTGRNFETRTFEEKIVKDSFKSLSEGVMDFINETEFKRFIMIIRSAGFTDKSLIRSQNVLNFAYILYLVLRRENYRTESIGSYVRKWFVMSILTKRYSGSPESAFDFDVKRICDKNFPKFLEEIETAELSPAFWEASLVQSLNTSVASSPYFNVFLATQVKSRDKGFLSSHISVTDLINQRGDIHHIFPRDYLKKHGLPQTKYNQIANYVYMQSEINIKIGNKPPKQYLSNIKKQINSKQATQVGFATEREFELNLKKHCIPKEISQMGINDYENFLEIRRGLIAQKIKKYYYSL